MLSNSLKFCQTQRTHNTDEDDSLKTMQFVKGKLEVILQELMAEKQAVEMRFKEQRRFLEAELDMKTGQIDRLEQRIRQLQGENQQIKYQYEQRVSMMAILKDQNRLITKEFQREKEQLRLTIEALVSENRELKDALIEAHFEQRRRKKSQSREVLLGDYYCEQFFSCQDLDHHGRTKTEEFGEREKLTTEGRANTEQDQENLSRSSIAAAMLKKNSQKFKESRVTRIKSKGDLKFQLGLQKMSTRTHLSRQRSSNLK